MTNGSGCATEGLEGSGRALNSKGLASSFLEAQAFSSFAFSAGCSGCWEHINGRASLQRTNHERKMPNMGICGAMCLALVREGWNWACTDLFSCSRLLDTNAIFVDHTEDGPFLALGFPPHISCIARCSSVFLVLENLERTHLELRVPEERWSTRFSASTDTAAEPPGGRPVSYNDNVLRSFGDQRQRLNGSCSLRFVRFETGSCLAVVREARATSANQSVDAAGK